MPNQSRFDTVESGDTILQELMLSMGERARWGETFPVHLIALTPSKDAVSENEQLIFVKRLRPERMDHSDHSLVNGDDIYATKAQLTPDGEEFDIDFTFPYGLTSLEGPLVRVSDQMERIKLQSFGQTRST